MLVHGIVADDERRINLVFLNALKIGNCKISSIDFRSAFDWKFWHIQTCKASSEESIDRSDDYCGTTSTQSQCRWLGTHSHSRESKAGKSFRRERSSLEHGGSWCEQQKHLLWNIATKHFSSLLDWNFNYSWGAGVNETVNKWRLVFMVRELWSQPRFTAFVIISDYFWNYFENTYKFAVKVAAASNPLLLLYPSILTDGRFNENWQEKGAIFF